jgi:fibronectin type 3 domain-containing protein
MKRRILSLVLTLTVAGNFGLALSSSAFADEIESEEENTKVLAAEENETAMPVIEDGQSITEDDTEAAVVTIEIPESEALSITGFVPLEQAQYCFEQKMDLDELTALFPQTLSVYINGEENPQELPVLWQCESDYTDTNEKQYVFKPVWDSQLYSLGEEVSDAIPFITIDYQTAQTNYKILTADAPTLTEISSTDTVVTLKWNAVSGANQYHIYRKTSDTSWKKIGTTALLNYTDTTALADVSYSYAVRAIFIQEGSETRSARSTPFLRVGKPTLISAKETSSGIGLQWNAVESAESYDVYRRTSANEDWTLLGNTDKLSFADRTAKLKTKYYYSVRAVCTNETSKFSSVYSIGKSAKRTLAVPKITSIEGTKTKVTLKWSAVSGAEKYRIQRKESNGTWTTLGKTSQLTYQDKTAKQSKTYRYRVSAVKTDSTGGLVYGMAQVPGVQRPGSTKLIGAVSESNGIRVSWNAVSGVKKYRVYRKKSAEGTWKLAATVTDTAYLDTKAEMGTTYWYTVRAVGQNPTTFYGGFDSAGVKAKQVVSAPTIAQISNSTEGVKLQWDKINHAAGYRIYRKAVGDSKWTVIKKSTTQTSYVDQTTTTGKKYTYSIRAIDRSGSLGDYSDSRSITYLKVPVLKSVSNTSRGISVSWKKVSGASGYCIYRRINGSGNAWEQLVKLSGKANVSYTDNTVVNGTVYDYTVCAYYGSTTSEKDSSGITMCFLQAIALEDLIQKESRTIELSWETNNKATGYIVSYSTSESFQSEKTVQASGGSTKISGLKVDEIYYFRVKAYKQVDGKRYETAWSDSQIVAIES